MSREDLCKLVHKIGLSGKVDLDELSRKEIINYIEEHYTPTEVDYDELSRKELCDLVRQRGLTCEVDELSRSEIVNFLKANESGVNIDYDEMTREQLCNLARHRRLDSNVNLDDMGRSQIVDLLKSQASTTSTQFITRSEPSISTSPETATTSVRRGGTDRRLFTQCSVRMAAGVFFDAIIGSKKFRDCIRNFHASRETNIKVEDINSIEANPLRAPYYLNNIFDQLHGDAEFKKFYGYLKNDVPFVFTLPAYIVGALMTYTGMLVRNAIIKQRLEQVEEVHLRYFGKGGRLFEWLFFTFRHEEVSAYLNACF